MHMHLFTRKEIKAQLEEQSGRMKYALGQNYLVSIRALSWFLSNFAHTPQIVEIGPGIGNITINYFKDYKRVILIELDEEKIPLLKKNLTLFNNNIFPEWVTIIHGNVLTYDYTKELDQTKPYELIGALPYNIAKKIITNMFTTLPYPTQALFIIQKEVAEKYTAQVPNATFLSISSALFATIEKKEIIKPDAFYPIPKVASRIIRIHSFIPNNVAEAHKLKELSSFIKKCFSHKRKRLSNVLKIRSELTSRRPQEINLGEWRYLFRSPGTQ